MQNLYNRDYYEHGIELGISGYSNYRWMPELSLQMCHELVLQLNIKKEDIIVDFGCAKGYLVKAFRLLHYNAYGVDISNYALSKTFDDIKFYLYQIQHDASLSDVFSKNIDWIIAKDVLEHIHYENIDFHISDMSSNSKNLFAIIPLGDGEKYVIPSCNKDITHIIKEDIEWWNKCFIKNGFDIIWSTHQMKNMREHWRGFEKGIGFFNLKSKTLY